MPARYDALVPALKRLLPARRLASLGRVVGFIERLRAIRAGAFVWSTVLSRFEPQRPGFSQARRWYKRLTGRSFWPRPFQMRFKDASSVALFQRAFEDAVTPWRQRRRISHPLARHFADVVAWDSTWMQLLDCLRRAFKGTASAKSSLKVCLGISVFGLLPVAAQVVAGNAHDMLLFPPLDLFRPGTLFLFDKGFVAYARLREISQAGNFFRCPMRLNGNALITGVNRGPAWLRKAVKKSPAGVWLKDVLPSTKRISRVFDLEVRLRPKARRADKRAVSLRLVIAPGPEGTQRPYLTNLSATRWSPDLLREAYRLRWQIKLVFKELKQHLSLEVLPAKTSMPCRSSPGRCPVSSAPGSGRSRARSASRQRFALSSSPVPCARRFAFSGRLSPPRPRRPDGSCRSSPMKSTKRCARWKPAGPTPSAASSPCSRRPKGIADGRRGFPAGAAREER